ncbi:hypothetical protein KVH22_03530 [Streptomyces olivaceus]|nr:hypothetical protein [Streptomyces olivaceus]MBZ6254632.1 hypothetical protein [Streptomyces olivaceus]GHI91043.1 hypothetical protein TPA0905_05140 [Streptomyces olivaceus]
MGNSDLTVDIALLKASEKQLHSIQGEFEDIDGWKKELRAVVGAERMVGAMSTFVDNWDRHRKELVEEIGKVGGWIGSTRKAFEDLDRDLANQVKQKKAKGKGK